MPRRHLIAPQRKQKEAVSAILTFGGINQSNDSYYVKWVPLSHFTSGFGVDLALHKLLSFVRPSVLRATCSVWTLNCFLLIVLPTETLLSVCSRFLFMLIIGETYSVFQSMFPFLLNLLLTNYLTLAKCTNFAAESFPFWTLLSRLTPKSF